MYCPTLNHSNSIPTIYVGPPVPRIIGQIDTVLRKRMPFCGSTDTGTTYHIICSAYTKVQNLSVCLPYIGIFLCSFDIFYNLQCIVLYRICNNRGFAKDKFHDRLLNKFVTHLYWYINILLWGSISRIQRSKNKIKIKWGTSVLTLSFRAKLILLKPQPQLHFKK